MPGEGAGKPPIFLLVPRLDSNGPVKGAVALANGLSTGHEVHLVSLKEPDAHVPHVAPAVVQHCLSAHRGWAAKSRAYRELLRRAARPASLSFCFSADLVNRLARKDARIFSSVRGNLPRNYYYTYGWKGLPFALAHLLMLRGFEAVFPISRTMAEQLRFFGLSLKPIGNSIDEPALEEFRRPADRHADRPSDRPSDQPVHFVFLGSLTTRKRPEQVLRGVKAVAEAGLDCRATFAGDGPLAAGLRREAEKLGIASRVRFAGHLGNPYPLLQEADYLVLPSESEGISRAVLEALYFGVPCIIRDVDGARELIADGKNGFLFRKDKELHGLMARLARGFDPGSRRGREVMIPDFFRHGRSIAILTEVIDVP